MAREIVKLAHVANPTIDQVFHEFLAEQGQPLKPKTLAKYKDVIDLLRHNLNGYAYEGLSRPEAALFEKHYNAEGDAHREFCELFGPEKIAENLGSFLGYFMIRKVMCGANLKRTAGTVTKKLSRWLAEKGYISEGAAEIGEDRGADAARDLTKAEKAARVLAESTARLPLDPVDLPDEDYLHFDHYTVVKLEAGKLWLEVFEGGDRQVLGPIPVPKVATGILERGWDISCALGRVQGKWRIVEVANVYPT